MAKYRRKPIVIEAIRWPGHYGYRTDWPLWIDHAVGQGVITFDNTPQAIIHTLEGDMRANVGDWIIQGVKGELHPIRADIFEATYEIVDA